MKQIKRVFSLFVLFAVLTSVDAFAADAGIDTGTAADGYFTVFWDGVSGRKMKVGVTFEGETTYYTYKPGTTASYAFDRGDGTYRLALYLNLSGTSYRKVAGTNVSVKLKDALAPYLVSTAEITFEKDDAISKKAAKLCTNLTDDEGKIVAIHNYIAGNFSYDDEFAGEVKKGIVVNYIPDTNQTLEKKTGVCYDLSAVFAAMCRSQGIPCAIAKGYTADGYHAWNMIQQNGEWVEVDITAAVIKKDCRAEDLSDCIVSINVIR